MQIVQIVARLAPAIDGVGDYARLLAKQLRAIHNIHTVFVVCDPAWKNSNCISHPYAQSRDAKPENQDSNLESSSVTLDGFPVYQIKSQNAEELLRVLLQPAMPRTVLLQFVGYGYQKRGCPVWLLRGLSTWLGPKAKEGGQQVAVGEPSPGCRRLITMFHELYAFGPPWSSSFWTSPVQKWLAKSLAQISEHCFTNLTVNARTLVSLTSRKEKDFTVLPVFSNVGEPEHLPSWNERQPRMIVFGSAGWRCKAYREYKSDLEHACRVLGLKEIVDIGATVDIQNLDLRVSQRGILSPGETSKEMLSARAGFFAYPTNCLGKSGIFAAYAAHGLAPVTFGGNRTDNRDGLILNEHFISSAHGHEGSCENIGMRAREWYLGHTIEAQANGYKQHLFRNS